jgi:DNA polymerase-3 subunit delta
MPSKTNPIALIAGTDEWAVKKAALALSEKRAPADAMNFEIIDAQVDTVEEAVRKIASLREAILTLPFFGGTKLVWWKNVNFLGDTVVGRSASVLEALEALGPVLEKVDGLSVALLISALGMDKRRSFYKTLAKRAEVEVYDLPELKKIGVEEAVFRIRGKFREAGLQADERVAERMFESVGLDPRALEAELEKLDLYHADKTLPVTLEEVREMVGAHRDVLIWDLCDAVIGGQAPAALHLLKRLCAQEESEAGILILLAGQVRLAALAGVLLDQKMMRLVRKGNFVNAELTAEGESLLPRKKTGEATSSFLLAKVAERARRKPAAYWFHALEKVYQAQRQLLTSAGDKTRILESAVMAVAGA